MLGYDEMIHSRSKVCPNALTNLRLQTVVTFRSDPVELREALLCLGQSYASTKQNHQGMVREFFDLCRALPSRIPSVTCQRRACENIVDVATPVFWAPRRAGWWHAESLWFGSDNVLKNHVVVF